jgi:hypothetical protein
MTKHFQHRTLLLLLFNTTQLILYGQNETIIYHNNSNAYLSKINSKDTLLDLRLFERKINDVILNPDGTFEFWSTPHVSCFTWHSYKGT